MKEILIFAGTTEGRALSEALTDAGIAHTVCVATEYGEIVLKENPLVSIHRGRMDQEEIRHFVEKGNFLAVVDATHPYATVVTQNIKAAMKDLSIPYLRLKREWEEGRIEGVRSRSLCGSFVPDRGQYSSYDRKQGSVPVLRA